MDSNGYSVRVARSLEEVRALSDFWRSQPSHPNADLDFYLTILESRPEAHRPHVLVIERDGAVEALVVGRYEEIELPCSIGYRVVYRPRLRAISVIRGGFLGRASDEAAHAAVAELMRSLARNEAEVATIGGVRTDDPLFKAARAAPSFWRRGNPIERTEHQASNLPESLDEFLKRIKSKHRYWMRRMRRLMEKDFAEDFEIRTYHRPEELDALLADAEIVARQTYQRALGVGFKTDEETRGRLALCAERGWLRGYALHAGGAPRAFWISMAHQNTCYLNYTGYDSALKSYEPGTVLFLAMIEEMCREGIRRIDYGQGQAFYKRRFGDEKWEEASVRIFAPTARAIRINLVRSALGATYAAIGAPLRGTKLWDFVRKTWRDRLRKEREDDSGDTEGSPSEV